VAELTKTKRRTPASAAARASLRVPSTLTARIAARLTAIGYAVPGPVVAIGVVLAALAFIQKLAKSQLDGLGDIPGRVLDDPKEQALLDRARGRIQIFDFGGPLSFGAAADAGHRARERTSGDTAVLILDFSRVPFVDISAARAIETIAQDAHRSGRLVFVSGMNDEVADILHGLEVSRSFSDDGEFETRIDALEEAIRRLDGEAGRTRPSHCAPERPAPSTAS